MKSGSQKHCLRLKAITVARRLLAIAIALSFTAVLLPFAGAAAEKTMPCCIGKTAGHCDSGIASQELPPPLPKGEVLCGLKNSHLDDGVTIVAESSDNEPHDSFHPDGESTSSRLAAESSTLGQPCHSDCCACVGSARQQNRQPGIEQAVARYGLPFAVRSRFNDHPHFFSSNIDWDLTSPRGPPASIN